MTDPERTDATRGALSGPRGAIAPSVGSGRGDRPSRIAVLVSGNGTNLQALMDAIRDGGLRAEITLVVSSEPEAPALERARKAGIPTASLPYASDPGLSRQDSRRRYDAILADHVASGEPDWVFLLGWMRILSEAFIGRFRGRILNLHPALPGTFPGTRAIERAWEAFGRGEIRESGVMLHFVPDEGVDCGPLFSKKIVPMRSGESLDRFGARIHEAEHALVAEAARALFGPEEGV